jgi:c-di-GMP-binding flagellar brake protein YcgR
MEKQDVENGVFDMKPDKKDSNSDKRKRKRLRDSIEVKLTVIPEEGSLDEKNIIFPITQDISLSGMRVYSDRSLPSNTLVKLDFKLEDMNKSIVEKARVKWTSSKNGLMYEIGLEFVDANPQTVYTLIGHIYKKTK